VPLTDTIDIYGEDDDDLERGEDEETYTEVQPVDTVIIHQGTTSIEDEGSSVTAAAHHLHSSSLQLRKYLPNVSLLLGSNDEIRLQKSIGAI